ncbi:MAG: choloylglycine hydrolase [Oscillospiraceae bacterium]|nr:choloylglycine hydrolase [Oscillospiraceae bacterium]
MCTAISFLTKQHYFGRNLDLEYHYNETVTITPRHFRLSFRYAGELNNHYAYIGMATIEAAYPLYYDATNEFGLSMAGLNFPHFAKYQPLSDNKTNIAPFEFIPWILSQCKTVSDAERILSTTNLTDICFSEKYPQTPLHWIICDRYRSVVVEPTATGLEIHENPVGVLTNSPGFTFQMYNLANYLNLTPQWPQNRFSNNINLEPYSAGMGALGLPGDLSSASRFVRAAFTKLNSVCDQDENSSVSQFFHILDSVAQQRGCVQVNGKLEKTVYSSCCNTNTGIYYYTTYENRQITAVCLYGAELNSNQIVAYPLRYTQQIVSEND